MAAKFYTGVDLCNQEFLRARFQNLTAAPTTYAEGMVYYDNSTANNTKGRAVLRSTDSWKALAFITDLDSYVLTTTYNGLSDTVGKIDTRLKSVETIFETDNDGTINKWNEVVAFLAGIEGDNLDSMLDTFALKATSITAGTGLTGTIKLDGTGTFALATVGTADTYYKVTTDAYGRVTSGVKTLEISDVTGLSTRLSGIDTTVAGHTTSIATLQANNNTLMTWYNAVGQHFKYDSDKEAWYLDGDFYATGQNAAGGAGEEDGGGSGIILDYNSIVDALGYIPAKESDLGKYLLTTTASSTYATIVTVTALTNRVSALEEKSTSVSYAASTASSAVIGTLTIDGQTNNISLRAVNVTSALGYTPTRKFTGTITSGGSVTQTFTHGFNTRDVIVQIFEPSAPYEQVYADVKATSTTQVQITFAESPTKAYKVVIIG